MITLLTRIQIIFIAVSALVVALIAFILSYYCINKKLNKKHFNEHYYKTIYDIAMTRDYYLINNFSFKTDEKHSAIIDHILFGDKYIYLILDCYYEGDLTGSIQDPSLVLIKKDGKKQYVHNEIIQLKTMLDRLVISTELDQEYFIGIILVNDDVNLDIKQENKKYYYIQRNKVSNLVKAIESRDVKKFNQKELEGVVHTFDKLNRGKRK